MEAGVLVVERWIMAALRKRQFFSLRAVNAAARVNDYETVGKEVY
jgi:hypothetical protein